MNVTVDHASQEVRFTHQVFREYFQSRAVLRELVDEDRDWLIRVLATRPLPEQARRFVASKLIPELVRSGVLGRRREHGSVTYTLNDAAKDDARRLIEDGILTGDLVEVVNRLAPSATAVRSAG